VLLAHVSLPPDAASASPRSARTQNTEIPALDVAALDLGFATWGQPGDLKRPVVQAPQIRRSALTTSTNSTRPRTTPSRGA